ncbi:MAG: hypothetical protein KC910_19100 [Candidatus Eremiobacteraeota bacterium]|nr:hypothetical protein [Candidatus Eremiobacteraeota bacterium]
MVISAAHTTPTARATQAPKAPASPKNLAADVLTLGATREGESYYSAGKVLTRAASGAIGGAITLYLSGGGIGNTALLGAGVYGAIGVVVGGVAGAIAGAASETSPVGGAAIGAVVGGGTGALTGAVKGAILGGVAGLIGQGPVSGAIAGGLLGAAGL